MKLTIIIAINRFIIIVNFRNHFDKALAEIFQFRRALEPTPGTSYKPNNKIQMKCKKGMKSQGCNINSNIIVRIKDE